MKSLTSHRRQLEARVRKEFEHAMDPEFLRTLERLFLVSKQVLSGRFRAERRTRKRGSGVEFADHREYVPGDDVRAVDWNLYGRLEKLFVRMYEEEEDLPVYVLFDVSHSMLEGSPPKAIHAFRIGAAIAYIALASMDRATLMPFAGKIDAYMPPARGKSRIFRLFQSVRTARVGGQTTLQETAKSLVYRRPQRGHVVIISDFFDPDGFEEALRIFRYGRHHVVAVQVLDKRELNPFMAGDVELVEVESGRRISVTATASLIERYRQELKRYTKSLESYCRQHAIPYFLTVSGDDLDMLILDFMRKGGVFT